MQIIKISVQKHSQTLLQTICILTKQQVAKTTSSLLENLSQVENPTVNIEKFISKTIQVSQEGSNSIIQ